MARLYHVDIARYAAAADHKWVDNLLSHFELPGVEGGRQGSARRISVDGIQHIALVRLLTRRARPLASQRRSPGDATPGRQLGSARASRDGLELRLDLEQLSFEHVERSIADGVESVTPARRGRPRKSPIRSGQ